MYMHRTALWINSQRFGYIRFAELYVRLLNDDSTFVGFSDYLKHYCCGVVIWSHWWFSIPQLRSTMTSSNGIIFRVTGPLCGEFTGHGWIPSQRPVTRSFDVFFHLCPYKRLSKQSRGWWFETKPCSLWRHCDNSYTTNSGVNTCYLMLFTFSHSIVLPSWC